MRVFIAYIFLIVFSLQVLPVKEIGKLLLKGAITEEKVASLGEETEDELPDTDYKLKKGVDPLHNTHQIAVARNIHFSQEVNTILHHHSVYLPAFHVPDIFTPPPNCA